MAVRLLKTTNSLGHSAYVPYSDGAVEAVQSSNKHGAEFQQMSVFVVNATYGKNAQGENEITHEDIEQTIYQLPKHRGVTPAKLEAKEAELAERELAAQMKEERLRQLEMELARKDKKTPVNA